MRIVIGSFAVLMAFTLMAPAQPAVKEDLGSVLAGWEKAMSELKSFVAVAERTNLVKNLGAKDDHKGYAMFMKAANKNETSRARLEMVKVGKQDVFEKYICTGTFLYEYVPSNQTVRVHTLPDNKNGGMQESFLSFLFGMTAAEAQKRYDMKLVQTNPPDKHYHYILIKPKDPRDSRDFEEARLSLFRSNNLPAQIWYLQPTKNEITWNFKDLQLNVQIPLKYFEAETPAGWKLDRVMTKPEIRK